MCCVRLISVYINTIWNRKFSRRFVYICMMGSILKMEECTECRIRLNRFWNEKKTHTHTLLCAEKEGNDMDFNNHKNVLCNRFGWCSTVYSCMSALSLCLCHFQPSKYSISFRAITTSNVHRRRIHFVIALNLRAKKEQQTKILIHKISHFYATTYATHFETNRITQSIRQIIYDNFIELVLRRSSFSFVSFMFVEFNKIEMFMCRIEPKWRPNDAYPREMADGARLQHYSCMHNEFHTMNKITESVRSFKQWQIKPFLFDQNKNTNSNNGKRCSINFHWTFFN